LTPEACNTLLEDLRLLTEARVCKRKTRHDTKYTHESLFRRHAGFGMRIAHVVMMQFKQTNRMGVKGNFAFT
jgi:hypothetical protein